LPFIIQLLSKYFCGAIADCIRRHGLLTLDAVTKLFNSIASFGAGGCILAVGFLGCNDVFWAVFLICASLGLLSADTPGFGLKVEASRTLKVSSPAS
jgi:hypothetical protein